VSEALTVPAIRTKQGNTLVYAMFVRGADILNVADLDRVKRTDKGILEGFQRKEIRQHVNEIAQYLNDGGTLFPNAIILALDPGLTFTQSRGPKAKDSIEGIDLGRLVLPLREEGDRAAWIVDGQQRALAIKKSNARELVVPVVAFEAASVDVQREQFILVNRARPLPKRLIDELLPDTHGVLLPRDLTARQLPSHLCNALNTHAASPFRGMLRRVSQPDQPEHIVTDSALLSMIRRSLNNPNGALAGFKSLGDQSSDANGMLQLLIDFWSAVKQVFPEAWGKPSSESRLMHSAGISAMGELMDRIVARADNGAALKEFFIQELGRIEKDCAWTHGLWPGIDRSWDSFQSTPRDIKTLSQVLVQIYAQRSRQ
jgi:DGQHR domain-containing protein